MSEEREKRPGPTGFSIEGYWGVFEINPDNTGISLEDPRRGKSIDFSFVKEGVCRYPQTVKALEAFRSPDVLKDVLESMPIYVSTQDATSGKYLMVSVDYEGNIHVIIRSGSDQAFSFLLGREDKGHDDKILSSFIKLALAIQEDEARIQDQILHPTFL